MFSNSRGGFKRKEEINYRAEEKKILDSVLGPKVYDKRIRPSGKNSTGEFFFFATLGLKCVNKNVLSVSLLFCAE